MTIIVWRFSSCSLYFQWWFWFLENTLIWFKQISSVKKLPISDNQDFLDLFLDLNGTCKILLAKSTEIWNFDATGPNILPQSVWASKYLFLYQPSVLQTLIFRHFVCYQSIFPFFKEKTKQVSSANIRNLTSLCKQYFACSRLPLKKSHFSIQNLTKLRLW